MPGKDKEPLKYFLEPEKLLTVKNPDDAQVKSFAQAAAVPVSEVSPYARFPEEGADKGSDFTKIDPGDLDRDTFMSRKSLQTVGPVYHSIDEEATLGMTRSDIGIYNSSDYDSDNTGKHFFAWPGATNYLQYIDGSSPSQEEVKYLFVTYNDLNDVNAKDLVYGLSTMNYMGNELWQRPFAMAVQLGDKLDDYYVRNADGSSTGTQNLNIALSGSYVVTKFSIKWNPALQGGNGARELTITSWKYTVPPVPPFTQAKLNANLASIPNSSYTIEIDQSIDQVCPMVALQKKEVDLDPRQQLVAVRCLD